MGPGPRSGAEYLLAFIGFGFIRIKSKENACVLTVSPKDGLIKIVNLINGNLRTPKIYQVSLLIDWLNAHHNLNIGHPSGAKILIL